MKKTVNIFFQAIIIALFVIAGFYEITPAENIFAFVSVFLGILSIIGLFVGSPAEKKNIVERTWFYAFTWFLILGSAWQGWFFIASCWFFVFAKICHDQETNESIPE